MPPYWPRLAAYGATSDAFHITQPAQDGEGGAKAMQMALRKAGMTTADIDYINAHGTSTAMNDKCETMAIKSVFGEQAYRIPVSSTKSMMGHLIGAAGAIEAIVCVLAIQNGHSAAHHQPGKRGPGLRPRLRTEHTPATESQGRHVQLLRIRRAQLRALVQRVRGLGRGRQVNHRRWRVLPSPPSGFLAGDGATSPWSTNSSSTGASPTGPAPNPFWP